MRNQANVRHLDAAQRIFIQTQSATRPLMRRATNLRLLAPRANKRTAPLISPEFRLGRRWRHSVVALMKRPRADLSFVLCQTTSRTLFLLSSLAPLSNQEAYEKTYRENADDQHQQQQNGEWEKENEKMALVKQTHSLFSRLDRFQVTGCRRIAVDGGVAQRFPSAGLRRNVQSSTMCRRRSASLLRWTFHVRWI